MVCSDEKIIQAGDKIIKDSTGYNLVQLFTGSEGTPGIITEAILSIKPEPEAYLTVLAPFHIQKMFSDVSLLFLTPNKIFDPE
ncbi:MAG: FAD-binding oxidoreductase [Candidatus Ratteibacteria bacterium]